MKKAILFFLLLGRVFSASYYVDYVSGADTNAGTSTGAAWKHCPGDPAATNTAGAATLAAGDTVYFKGGVSYVFTGATGIITSFSGSAGNVITYDGNSSGAWGTGKAVLTDNYGGNSINAFSKTGIVSYLTFKNFSLQNIGGSASLPADGGSAIASRPGGGFVYDVASSTNTGSDHITVQNCDFNGFGYIFNQKPMGSSSISGGGFYLVNVSTFTITGCTFTRCPNPIWFVYGNSTSTASSIQNCTMHNWIKWGITVANLNTSGVTIPAISISGCSIYDYPEFDDPNWTGYGDWPHTDGIFLYKQNPSDSVTWNTTSIYNCSFTKGNSGGSAAITFTEGPNADLFNCVFIYGAKGRNIYIHNTGVTSAQTLRFFNNSFLSNSAPAISFENSQNGTSNLSATAITIKNNLFQNTLASGASYVFYGDYVAPTGTWDIDYNLYRSANTYLSGTWGGTDGTDFMGTFGGVSEGGITQMRAKSWEAHGDSIDVKYVAVNANGDLCDVHLQSSSPARGAGVNLTSLGITALNSDAAGAARPSSAAWDIGAYQYGAADTTPPTPNPATIASTSVLGTTSFSVTATTATDETSLGSAPYRFSSDNGSNWTAYQSSATYTFTGLTPNTGYQVKVQYQDASANAGTASGATTVTTQADGNVNPGTSFKVRSTF